MGGGGKIPYPKHCNTTLPILSLSTDPNPRTPQSLYTRPLPSSVRPLLTRTGVYSPAGGWYGQPHNWKTNTAVMGLVIAGVAAIAFKTSADREVRYKMPEPDRFFPSRNWSKQIIEHEKAQKEASS